MSSPDTWFVIVCRECSPELDLVMPFESPEARGRWASEHKRGTGHDRWLVLDEPMTDEERSRRSTSP